jgi:hypothetical protein
MVEGGDGAGFALETLGETLGGDFDGDFAAEAGVASAVDCAHAAGSSADKTSWGRGTGRAEEDMD